MLFQHSESMIVYPDVWLSACTLTHNAILKKFSKFYKHIHLTTQIHGISINKNLINHTFPKIDCSHTSVTLEVQLFISFQ